MSAIDIEKSDEHVAWERRLGDMGLVVGRWQKRTQQPQPPLAEDSPLAIDDAVPGLPLASLVWYQITVAVEHLDFFIDAARATSTAYPTAYLTVLRTGLLAASQAVWILGPDDRGVRLERAFRTIADDLRGQLAMVRDSYAPDADAQATKDRLITNFLKQQKDYQQVADVLGVKIRVKDAKLNNTELIAWAAERIFEGKGDAPITGAISTYWRMGSAAAHAQRSHALMRAGRSELVRHDDGSATALLRGDLENDIGPAASAVFIVLTEAIRRFDQLRASPSLV